MAAELACSCVQPSPQVLHASLPLLVYEYEDHPDATAPNAVVDPADSTTTTTKTVMYSLSERSIVDPCFSNARR